MAWTAPLTWTTGQIVTAANLNQQIRDNLLETASAKAAAAGDVFVATGANAIKKVTKGTTKQVFRMKTDASEPEWSTIDDFLALAGGTLSGEVNFADNFATRLKLKDYSEQVVIANTGAEYAIDLESGNVFKLTVTGDAVLTITNPPATGLCGSFTLILIRDATPGRSVTLPTAKYAYGAAPTLTTTAAAVDILTYFTVDAGTTWYGFMAGTDVK